MRKTYKVAGHLCALVMADDADGWNNMANFEPFLVDDSGDCLFEIELVDALPDTSDKEKVTWSCNAPNEPRYEFYKWRF